MRNLTILTLSAVLLEFAGAANTPASAAPLGNAMTLQRSTEGAGPLIENVGWRRGYGGYGYYGGYYPYRYSYGGYYPSYRYSYGYYPYRYSYGGYYPSYRYSYGGYYPYYDRYYYYGGPSIYFGFGPRWRHW
jgi:hypothetical protein